MAAWPDTLPKPLLNGYGMEPQDAVIKTNMEAGPKRYRKRFTAVPYDLELSFVMTAAQMAIFKDFWHNQINLGADWFTFNGLNLGNGFTVNSEVHAVMPYKASLIDPLKWQVNLSIEVRNA
jgi:hypothetical protein